MRPKFRQEADMSFTDPRGTLEPAVSQVDPAAADLDSEPV
jgi:hypothetical protein